MKLPRRILQLWRNSPHTLWVILFTNLWEVFGVLVWNWSAILLAWVYWWENVAVGLVTIPRILLAGGFPRGALRKLLHVLGRGFVCLFFFVHFGAFTAVHGVLVTIFWLGISEGVVDGGPKGISDGLNFLRPFEKEGWPLVLAVGLIFAGHLYSLVANTLIGGEYRRTKAYQCMEAPYPRVIAMHLTVILGAFLVLATRLPQTFALVLIPAKICADLTMHARERERFRREAVAHEGE